MISMLIGLHLHANLLQLELQVRRQVIRVVEHFCAGNTRHANTDARHQEARLSVTLPLLTDFECNLICNLKHGLSALSF